MKPFNLEAALKGEKVVTRDGREVTQLVKFDAMEIYPLKGVMNRQVHAWTEKGEFNNEVREHNYDLFMAPKEVTLWVNVYKQKSGKYWFGDPFLSEEETRNVFKDMTEYICTKSITVEEV